MKKITAIVIAVILAFVIAMGDQIIRLSLSDNPLGLNSIKSFFGFDDGAITLPTKPSLPTISEKPEEVNLTYDERIKKGDYYAERGFLTYATNEYVKAANLEPTRLDPFRKLLKTNFDLGDYSKAKKNAEKILEMQSDDYQTQYYLVKIHIKQNDFTKADLLIDQLVAAGAVDNHLNYLKALLQITFGKHDEGKVLLNALVKDIELNVDLAADIQKVMSAYQEFEFAKAAEDLYLAELLSRSLNQIEEYEMSIYKLKNILRTRTDLRDAWILLGFAYLNLDNYLFALTSFEHAYEIDPEWPSTQYFLGITYSELRQTDDAIVYLNYALENGFEPAIVVQHKLADLYLDNKEYDKSVSIYESLLESNQQDINSFVRPIWIYLDFLQEPSKAVKLAELAVIAFPEDPMAYNLLGWSQSGTGNYIEAEKNLKKAIASDDQLAAAHYNLGKLYEDQEEDEKALKSYQDAYSLDQNGSIGNLAAKRYNALLIK